MSADRDLRVARLALRLHVGEDGDPLDNDILEAYESLPDSTIVRNDWIRRRLVIGHLLEREGISGLLAVIGSLSGGAVAPVPSPQSSGQPLPEQEADKPDPLPAAYKMPKFHEGPAAEIEQRVSAPAPKSSTSTKKKMFGLMPAISVLAEPVADAGATGQQQEKDSASAPAAQATSVEDEAGPGSSDIKAEAPPIENTSPADLGESAPAETKPGLSIDASQQPVIRIHEAAQPGLSEQTPAREPVASDPSDDTRAMLERFSVSERSGAPKTVGTDFNPVLEPDFQD